MGRDGLVREFCAENMTVVPTAIAAGADRIELCDNLAVGGTTPSFGVIERTVAYAHERAVRVMVMIRPRGGDFVYTQDELAMMEADARIALALGADGVVVGCLWSAPHGDGFVLDRPALEHLMAIVREAEANRGSKVDVTFHMAFDELPRAAQPAAIDELTELGVTRILTHGGPAGAPLADTLPHLRALVEHAAGRMVVLPGGGVTHANAAEVARELGVREVHGTRIVPLERES